MLIIVGLILISLLMALGFLSAFIWAINSGQYDDTETPSRRVLFEQEFSRNKKN